MQRNPIGRPPKPTGWAPNRTPKLAPQITPQMVKPFRRGIGLH